MSSSAGRNSKDKSPSPPATRDPLPHAGEGTAQASSSASTDKTQVGRAKQLRTDQTDAERRLWYFLRAQRFHDLKFKRQKPIGPYIVDFACDDLRLVVELDGGQHAAEQKDYDVVRDAWLTSEGWSVTRFWNDEVLQQTEAVLEKIRQLALAVPSPACGRGSREAGGEGLLPFADIPSKP